MCATLTHQRGRSYTSQAAGNQLAYLATDQNPTTADNYPFVPINKIQLSIDWQADLP